MDTYTKNAVGATSADHESASRMMDEEPAAEPTENGWIVDNVSIRKAKNGGWIVTCSKHEANERSDRPGRYESNDYTFASLGEAVPFIEQEFGESAGGGMSQPTQAIQTGGMA